LCRCHLYLTDCEEGKNIRYATYKPLERVVYRNGDDKKYVDPYRYPYEVCFDRIMMFANVSVIRPSCVSL